ncbi:MAG: hypothetical protein M0Z25_09675 [Nitrospiraceae bacterium]|nr:hypothetical protein [Nitrospiraceae bacterium]
MNTLVVPESETLLPVFKPTGSAEIMPESSIKPFPGVITTTDDTPEVAIGVTVNPAFTCTLPPGALIVPELASEDPDSIPLPPFITLIFPAFETGPVKFFPLFALPESMTPNLLTTLPDPKISPFGFMKSWIPLLATVPLREDGVVPPTYLSETAFDPGIR